MVDVNLIIPCFINTLTPGIYFRKSCPGTPQQNGVAKRKHRHVIEVARIPVIG